jgi:CheY-like chemotaxis protein/HPt (histidine-containing phosphotransfer) domain-containing protein
MGNDVLIVEDNRISALVTERLVRRSGLSAQIAPTAKEALELLATGSYRLVLMDLQLPDMSGVEATRAIRDPSSPVSAHDVPVVVLSAYVSAEERAACRRAGADGFLEKPPDPEHLHALLERVAGATGTDAPADAGVFSPGAGAKTPAFDSAELETRLGSARLARTVAGSFLGIIEARVADVHAAVEEGEPSAIRTAAHALSSPAANAAARALRELLKDIEQAAVTGDIERARQLAGRLDGEAARLKEALEAYLSS